jgi:integrase
MDQQKGVLMNANMTQRELEVFSGTLKANNFHPVAVYAYTRHLRYFFKRRPEVLATPAHEARIVIDEYMCCYRVRDDICIVSAALHKWFELRYEERFLMRDKPNIYRRGEDIDYEIACFKRELVLQGIGKCAVTSTCNTVTNYLGWAFSDRFFKRDEVTVESMTEFVLVAKSHLKQSSKSQLGIRMKSYAVFLSSMGLPECLESLRSLPIAPAYWSQGNLPESMDDEDLEALLNRCDPSDTHAGARFRAAVLCMCNLGMRCAEVASIRLDDINFTNGIITVRAGKSSRARRLPLDTETGEAIAGYIMGFRPQSHHNELFIRDKRSPGEPMGVFALRAAMRRQARKAGIRDFRCHSLRRRAATRMVESGTPLKTVADTLGHEHIQTANEYVRLNVKFLRLAGGDWPGEHDE